MNSKISKVENLSIEQLRDAISIIAKAMEYTDIVDGVNGIIKARLNNGFGYTINFFFLYTDLLSGNLDIDSIINDINNVRQEVSINNINIISSKNISKGFKDKVNSFVKDININYVGRDELIKLIDKHYIDFWKHDDVKLIHYENDFIKGIQEDNQLKKLKLKSDFNQKLLSIFIEPTLTFISEEPQTHTLTRHRIDKKSIINEDNPAFICGLSGAGKTTLLKNIGISLIEENQQNKKKNVPIFITALEILQNEFDLNKIIRLYLDKYFIGEELKMLVKKYKIIILIDSIDEFEDDKKQKILEILDSNQSKLGILYFIGTRDSEQFDDSPLIKKIRRYEISRFDTTQMQRFISSFLSDDKKTSDLLDAIRSNKILEKLPLTPLTLSLITILFEETDFEIPATVTDIYDNFNSLILGRAVVSSKIEFIDASFRERVLSRYGLLLMENQNHQPFSEQEFYENFENYYNGKTLPINRNLLRDALSYLIHQTGILYVKDKKWVCFSHDTYMEYYAAKEIFKFERDKENKIIENFFDIHWQNVAIFYGGITKDMPDFAEAINKKIISASRINEFIASIQGGGYLLQALYQMDNSIKAKIIDSSLNKVLESNEVIKKMTTDDSSIFKNYSIPILQLINFIHFYEMFNSVTLSKSLELAFNNLYEKYCVAKENGDVDRVNSIGFKLLEIAFTLDSKRISNSQYLERLIDDNELLKDPNLYSLTLFSFDLLGKNSYSEMRKELQNKFYTLNGLRTKLLDTNTSKIRFSIIDTIIPDRQVKIFVEGKTDAQIIEHAYMVLTNGTVPYWNVRMATQNGETGSCVFVSNTIENSLSYIEDYVAIIGLYDHDSAGLSEYRKHRRNFEEVEHDSIKKHKIGDVYLMMLPIPGEMSNYLQKDQIFNFFEIEHLFGHEYLEKHKMLGKTPIENIYKINDSRKAAFADIVCKEVDPKVFINFIPLFELIDRCSGIKIEYMY